MFSKLRSKEQREKLLFRVVMGFCIFILVGPIMHLVLTVMACRAVETGNYTAMLVITAVDPWVVNMPTDIDPLDDTGMLKTAVYRSDIKMAELLIRKGANVNACKPSMMGSAALEDASGNGNLAIVKLLLKNGARLNREGKRESDALFNAVSEGHKEVADLLWEHGANGVPLVHRCAAFGDVAGLENGLNQCLGLCEKEDSHKWTPLDYAAFRRQVKTAKVLLDHGVSRKGIQESLGHAIHGGSLAVVKLLVENGADVNKPVKWGHTALHRAAEDGNRAVVEYLLSKGADVLAKTDIGDTPRDIAEAYGHHSVAKLLRSHEAVIQK